MTTAVSEGAPHLVRTTGSAIAANTFSIGAAMIRSNIRVAWSMGGEACAFLIVLQFRVDCVAQRIRECANHSCDRSVRQSHHRESFGRINEPRISVHASPAPGSGKLRG